mgnify:FL=1|jgi:selenide, water dikinase
MAAPDLTGPVAEGVRDADQRTPLCGGCGAKVGGGVLRTALAGATDGHPDVVTGTGDDAAILRQPGGGFQVLSTDHLRSFVEDPVMMTRIAAVHALGDVWAMGAAPQTALSTLILPRMSATLQDRTLREITDTAREVFAAAGAALVGGHTTMGAELTVGFAVTGTRATMPVTNAGARAGDVLLLTRPIGTGVILAAHMAGRAPARVLADTLERMARPQAGAARILSGAHAMTDVTGFGLLGHVQAICSASGVRAEITGSAVPVYPGARALSDAGVASSLLPANTADVAVTGLADPLLFDPQTAGGLLAAVAPDRAEAALSALREEGEEAAIIGTLRAGAGPITVS